MRHANTHTHTRTHAQTYTTQQRNNAIPHLGHLGGGQEQGDQLLQQLGFLGLFPDGGHQLLPLDAKLVLQLDGFLFGVFELFGVLGFEAAELLHPRLRRFHSQLAFLLLRRRLFAQPSLFFLQPRLLLPLLLQLHLGAAELGLLLGQDGFRVRLQRREEVRRG